MTDLPPASRLLGSLHRPAHHLVAGRITELPGYLVRRPAGSGDWLLMLTLSGTGRVGTPEGDFAVEPGTMVLLARGWPHDYGIAAAAEKWELLFAHFQSRPHWQPWLDWPEARGPKSTGPSPPRASAAVGYLQLGDRPAGRAIRDAFFETHRLAVSALPDALPLAVNAFEKLLILTRAVNPKANRARLDERIEAAIAYLGAHMAEPVTVEQVARAVHLSPSRLAHLFRRQTALSVMAFLERHRLERAKQLLESTPHTVAAVADQVGFSDPFYFSKRFKAYTGRGPRAYRRESDERPSRPVTA